MSQLAVVEARVADGTPVVGVRGEIDLSNAADVMVAIDRAVSTEADVVVLDLSDTTYVDSSGIAILFRLAERLDYRRQELRLVVPPLSPIRVALELVKLTHVVAVQDSLSAAGG